jgi:hypothetical protein
MTETQAQAQKLVVDSETYFALQMAKADDTIAAAEVAAATAQLNVAKAKKDKTQAIIDFHYSNLKSMQEKQLTSSDKSSDKKEDSNEEVILEPKPN